MIEYGKINSLRVVRVNELDIILDGGELGEISLPKKGLSGRFRANDFTDVFVYIDSKAQVIVTAHIPFAEAGQFALLKVVSSNSYGAFLDWGLEQDLRVSVKEQQKQMKKGHPYLVYVYNDPKNRISASSRLSKFIKDLPADFKEGQHVDLVIADITPLGYRAIINKTHLGVLYKNEVFKLLEQGQSIKGYIKKIREDGKIDLCLQKRSVREIDDLSKKIMNVLKEHGGSLEISDKTSPERIYNLFGVSKKRYKSAIGALYKKRLITVDDYAIKLAPGKGETPGKKERGIKPQVGRRIRPKR
ncbi:MAG: GntR family transcriptional regulator [Deltaproteobacteria bacterium]|nr:GntR family transcriptional regulator [Deltaproteobacteria bacterium]